MTLDALVTWLRSAHPKNVLIPVPKGEKRPIFPYRHDEWTWESFDAFIATGFNNVDWAIILKDLCVVDADDPEVAARLESAFPVLRQVPAEKTRRGTHYFFRRSAVADEQCYFDCCGSQSVLEHVDFKSITQTGTGGIIVVSPRFHPPQIRSGYASHGTSTSSRASQMLCSRLLRGRPHPGLQLRMRRSCAAPSVR